MTHAYGKGAAQFPGIPATIAQHRARLKHFAVEGETITYVDEGLRTGPPVLLLHGMPTSSWLWRGIIPRLASQGLRIIAPDMVGFGASAKPAEASRYAFALQAHRLHALMTALGIGRWTQVAHDLGGPWTWELIEQHPECLDGLVVMNTTAYRDGFTPPAVMKTVAGPLGGLVAFMMRNSITGPGQVKTFLRQFVARPDQITDAVAHGYWQSMNEGTVHAFLAFARGFPWWFEQFERYQAGLKRLDVRAATLWGGKDAVLDAEKLTLQFARDLRIPHERQYVLDAGHFLQEDCPEEVAQIISNFVMAQP